MCQLGLALGKSLQEVSQLPSWEIDVWQAFYFSHPFGLREDLTMSHICATVANCRAFGNGKCFKAEDFQFKYQSQKQQDHNLKSFFKRLARED